jgi:hypothetical protein
MTSDALDTQTLLIRATHHLGDTPIQTADALKQRRQPVEGGRAIAVKEAIDVIIARSYVREVARATGLGTTDQARISLATSTLARVLGLGDLRHGTIVIDSLDGGERKGVRVTCETKTNTHCLLSPRTLRDVKFMSDELVVEDSCPDEIQVILIKWAS